MTSRTTYTAHMESGAELLNDVHRAVTQFCVLPSPDHEHAVVLWIATTHCVDAFDYATRLVIRSAEKRSGKSRLLEVIDGTCHRPLRAVNATTAALFRSLGTTPPPTVLMDEADSIFGTRKSAENNEDLRGLFNAGFQRGLPVLRTVGPTHTPMAFPTFAMLALAGIGRMPDTIEDRAVVIVMRRRKADEPVMPFRLRHDLPRLHLLRDRLAQWGDQIGGHLRDADPVMPVEDRAADTWAPLVAVADAAGGPWPGRARAAAARLTSEADDEASAESTNLLLLSDLRNLFAARASSFLTSTEVCDHLRTLDESPWGQFDLNPSKLGRRLRAYGITTNRNTSGTVRGYRIEDLKDTFDRYLPPSPSNGVRSRNVASDLRKRSDTMNPSDTLKVSDDLKVSEQNRRSGSQLTPSGTFGRDARRNSASHAHPCTVCGEPLAPVLAAGETTHPMCDPGSLPVRTGSPNRPDATP